MIVYMPKEKVLQPIQPRFLQFFHGCFVPVFPHIGLRNRFQVHILLTGGDILFWKLNQRAIRFAQMLGRQPAAKAVVKGSDAYPELHGEVLFYDDIGGTLVMAQMFGLPKAEKPCDPQVFAFHIHDGESCTGNESDPFADSGMHYNPQDCPHPAHAGDMPPLFGNDGYAYMVFYTAHFMVSDVIGRTVIVHSKPDDFKTQPSGDAGTKMACGQIVSV